MTRTATRAHRRGHAPRVGISGWCYRPWRGRFYPSELPHAEEFAYASRRFETIELNGSFYGVLRPEHYRSFAEATPPNFCFAVKAYTPGELTSWASCIRAWGRGDEPSDAKRIPGTKPARPRASRDVYVYFDNDLKAFAPNDAQALIHLLRGPETST